MPLRERRDILMYLYLASRAYPYPLYSLNFQPLRLSYNKTTLAQRDDED